jgi:hypothetical protein
MQFTFYKKIILENYCYSIKDAVIDMVFDATHSIKRICGKIIKSLKYKKSSGTPRAFLQ